VIQFALLLGIESALFALGAYVLVPLGQLSGVVALVASLLSLSARIFFTLGEINWMTEEHEALFAGDSRSAWERHYDRLSHSKHVALDVISGAPIREAEHLFLGVEPWQSFPVLLHRALLPEHTYIVGRTGSGKTSQGLMQYLGQRTS
jgi:ABC-type multidrug transport system fused ATPase/permease subunit